MPFDITPVPSTEPSQVNFTSTVRGATMYPNSYSGDLEGRYVDGLSLTVDCATCRHPRQHVSTLAAGTSWRVPEVASTQLRQGDSALLQTALTCPYPLSGVPPGQHCFLGNCECHTTQQRREASVFPYSLDGFRVPDFVGNNYFCDAGAGPLDSASGNAVRHLPNRRFSALLACWSERHAFLHSFLSSRVVSRLRSGTATGCSARTRRVSPADGRGTSPGGQLVPGQGISNPTSPRPPLSPSRCGS